MNRLGRMLGISVLYLFAHQDDEILILPKMAADLKSGRQVHAVWITDGARSANPARREQESRAGMRLVGVPETNLHFLGFPDQKSHRHLRAIHQKLLPILDAQEFSEIVSPAYEGGNIDHDVAAFMAAQLAVRAVHVEYPLYNRLAGKRRVGVFLPAPDTEEQFIVVDAAARALMDTAIQQYRSERVSLWLFRRIALKQGLWDRLSYRIAPPHNFSQRPAAEPCDYERSWFHRARFSEWQESVKKFLADSRPTTAS